MKIKLLMLALCFSLILVATSCNKVKPRLASASMDLYIYDTSVSFYHTDAFSKNKKQEIILAFWDNMPRPAKFESGPTVMEDLSKITCFLTKSNPTVKIQCMGEFDVKTGKGTVDIAGKTFNVSNGRLFMINIYEKPLKVIQINEQFNLPPFNNLSSLDDLSSFNKKTCLNAFSSCEKKFEYLAKNNKIVADFIADSKKSFDLTKNKSKDLKSNK